jgi:transcription elongation factor GreA
LVFRGEFYEANPGSSTRNTEANKSTSNLNRPHMQSPRIPAPAPLPLPSGAVNEDVKNAISPEGQAEAEAELKELTEVRRPAIVAAIKAAREEGDLSENAEYHAAREEQGLNEARIRVLEELLSSATVVEATGGEVVGPGSQVSFRDSSNDDVTDVTLVHRLEADLTEGKLSVESPIAKALLGTTKGDRVSVATPSGSKTLEILAVG